MGYSNIPRGIPNPILVNLRSGQCYIHDHSKANSGIAPNQHSIPGQPLNNRSSNDPAFLDLSLCSMMCCQVIFFLLILVIEIKYDSK